MTFSGLRLASFSSVGIVLTYVLALRTATGQYLDNVAMAVLSTAIQDADWAVSVLGLVSPATVLIGVAVATGVAWLARGPRWGLVTGGIAIGTVAISQILKEVLTRPTLLNEVASNSLPSGHVAAVAGVAVALTLAMPLVLRALVAVVGLACVTVTGLATIVLEWHRPSDVLVSGLIALAFGGLASTLNRAGGEGPFGDAVLVDPPRSTASRII